MNPFRSLHDYEEFIYTLPQQFPAIAFSTLVVYRRGARTGMVVGELFPDIKHNRIPTPGLSFTQPNILFLIREIEKSYLARLD